MGKKRTKSGSAQKRGGAAPVAVPESPSVRFVTVGWLLSSLTTILCVAAAGGGLLAAAASPQLANLRLFAEYMLFAGLIVGSAALVLLIAVLRVRPEPPPRALIVGSLVASAVPFLLLSLRAAELL